MHDFALSVVMERLSAYCQSTLHLLVAQGHLLQQSVLSVTRVVRTVHSVLRLGILAGCVEVDCVIHGLFLSAAWDSQIILEPITLRRVIRCAAAAHIPPSKTALACLSGLPSAHI